MFNLNKKYLLYFFPFFSFAIGYYLAHRIVKNTEIIAPTIVGEKLNDALRTTSNLGLNLKLLREKEDVELPEGIIIDQSPAAGKKIKPNQHLFVTVSKKPNKIVAPILEGQKYEEVLNTTKKLRTNLEIHWLESSYPQNICLAQYPKPNKNIGKKQIVSYLSSGKNGYSIFPNLKGKSLSEAKIFLETEGINVEIIHGKNITQNHSCEKCIVRDQKPVPGSIVNVKKKIFAQIQVS